ncbi:cytochrome P450 [Streptomyces gilvosporeus]|uniref:FAD/NAD(P)-binding domain-containing protein n=1 Tax=Streptomyces gilvosporeus TaxID=553510 RepID=A0A1V0TL59_9ACTN|nr:cytochrome P450 [Streptomyces gilvosporeus]ARF53671.1 hypothetical protein B1H19_05275 [Streptomyces gilvosporeus]
MPADTDAEVLRRRGRIVIVGASLAGLRAAETLRDRGFTGSLTLIGDEPYEPYDRPPLSKQVLLGLEPAGDTALPRRRDVAAEWRLGVAATGLDRTAKQVGLAHGDTVPYDRLLITTGTKARPWFHPEEAALDGVFVVRTRDDAARLYRKLAAGPRRVLVVGAGFTGSEIASVCRERGLEVTVAERGPSNATLTLLRHPDVLERFRTEPDLVVPLVEEVLRYEPPVQFAPFTTALADIDIADTTIPKGAQVWLLLASANRDPKRFDEPDRFVPDREDNQHLGFYTGIHYCFGAPLARMEAQLALPQLFRRLKNPRLLADPPPYRANPVLRGPRHLAVAIDGLAA